MVNSGIRRSKANGTHASNDACGSDGRRRVVASIRV